MKVIGMKGLGVVWVLFGKPKLMKEMITNLCDDRDIDYMEESDIEEIIYCD